MSNKRISPQKEEKKSLGKWTNKKENHDLIFQVIVDASPLAMYIFNSEMEILLSNQKARDLIGIEEGVSLVETISRMSPYRQPSGGISGELAKEYIHNTVVEGKENFYWMHLDFEGNELPCEITLKRAGEKEDGIIIVYQRDLRPEFIGNNKDNSYENYFLNNISDKTLVEKLSELSEEWFFVFDVRTSIVKYYGKVVLENGYKNGIEVNANTLLEKERVYKDDIDKYLKLIDNINNGVYEPLEIRYLQKDGSVKYHRMEYSFIYDNNMKPIYAVGKGVDINEQKKLEILSKTDLLTECYNKVSGEEIIKEKILKYKDKMQAFFIIDIDNFKEVNDTMGHFFGDEVLRRVAQGIKKVFRSSDIVVRLGGDEFIAFIEDVRAIEIAENKAEEILNMFNALVIEGERVKHISASVGVEVTDSKERTYSEMYKNADKALYKAKANGKNQYTFYSRDTVSENKMELKKLDKIHRVSGIYFDHDLVGEVFKILYSGNSDDLSISKAMELIGNKYNADRCYIHETFNKGKTYNNTYEWCRKGIKKQKKNLQEVSKDKYEELFEKAIQGILYTNDASGFFKVIESKEYVENQNIQSILHAQIISDGYIPFFIGVDSCTEKRVWKEKEINTLQYIAKIFSIIFKSQSLEVEIGEMAEYNKISSYVGKYTNNFVYISDIKSYDLYYLNKEAEKRLGYKEEKEWIGKKCYEILKNRTSPCKDCTNKELNETEVYERIEEYLEDGKIYLFRDKLIPLKGKLVGLKIGIDITKRNILEKEINKKLEEQNFLLEAIKVLHFGETPQGSINGILKTIGEFFKGDRITIFQLEEMKDTMRNTYEWNNKNIKSRIKDLNQVPVEIIRKILNATDENGVCYFERVEEEYEYNKLFLEIFKSQNVRTLISAPIKDGKDNLIGLLGVENSKDNIEKRWLIKTVVTFIAAYISKNDLLLEVDKLSNIDEISGSKNRYSYIKKLEELEKIDSNESISLGILYLNIRQLSDINSNKGVKFGDSVIKKIGSILNRNTEGSAYRIGGNEFAVLETGVSQKYFESKVKVIKEIFENEKGFGVTIWHTWNEKLDEKKEEENKSPHSLMLLKNVEAEIERGRFTVYFQPQINIQTDEICGAEALLRSVDSENQVHLPREFIPFYEREGIIHKLDIFVFEYVCKTLKDWKKKKINENIEISINCSRLTVAENNIIEIFSNLCEKYGIEKRKIIIEVTETINTIDKDLLQKVIEDFKGAGFRVSLDDFGSGSSNLESVALNGFNELKIDMSLIKNVHTDRKAQILTNVALTICEEFGDLISTAEGIEVVEQYELLKSMNCQKGQGYFFDRPMKLEDFNKKYITYEK